MLSIIGSLSIPTRHPIRQRIERLLPRLLDRQRSQFEIFHAGAGQGDGVDGSVVVEVAAAGQFEGPYAFDDSVWLSQGQDPDQGGEWVIAGRLPLIGLFRLSLIGLRPSVHSEVVSDNRKEYILNKIGDFNFSKSHYNNRCRKRKCQDRWRISNRFPKNFSSGSASSPARRVRRLAARFPLSTDEIYLGSRGLRDWVSYQL